VSKLYRAVANGNILADVPESLVTAGIYVPVEEDEPESEPVAPAPRDSALVQPTAEVLTTAHLPAAPAREVAARKATARPRKSGRRR
jgi:hypothetical protein